MKLVKALAGGLAGACAVTAIHQYLKQKDENAPRMDLLGMESLTKILQNLNVDLPDEERMYYLTLAGDILSNSVYYSLIGVGKKKTWLKGSALGLAAGLGAVLLPKPMGLNEKHSNRTAETQLLSVLYYFAGGLVTSGVVKLLNRKVKQPMELLKEQIDNNISK